MQWSPAAISPGVQQPGHENSHSPHLTPTLRMSRALSPVLLYAFMARTAKTIHFDVYNLDGFFK
jgi:hypothetical protein